MWIIFDIFDLFHFFSDSFLQVIIISLITYSGERDYICYISIISARSSCFSCIQASVTAIMQMFNFSSEPRTYHPQASALSVIFLSSERDINI